MERQENKREFVILIARKTCNLLPTNLRFLKIKKAYRLIITNEEIDKIRTPKNTTSNAVATARARNITLLEDNNINHVSNAEKFLENINYQQT
jgi:type II secretory pathway component PulC